VGGMRRDGIGVEMRGNCEARLMFVTIGMHAWLSNRGYFAIRPYAVEARLP